MLKVGDLVTFIDKLLQGTPESQRIGVVVSDVCTDSFGADFVAVNWAGGSWGYHDLEHLFLVARGE